MLAEDNPDSIICRLSPSDAVWEKNFQAAESHYKQFGNLRVKDAYTTPDEIRLGSWLKTLRSGKK